MRHSIRTSSRYGQRGGSLVEAAIHVAEAAADHAADLDDDGTFPMADIRNLAKAGLLLAPFPRALDGKDLGVENPGELLSVLTILGCGSLSLGRLFEGHVNAVKLVRLYGSHRSLALLRDEALDGFPSGVWMAEKKDPLRLVHDGNRSILSGCKALASGAGSIRRPLVAALGADGGSQMVLPRVDEAWRVDASAWCPLGMKATATATVDFTGIVLEPSEVIGAPGDYLRSPYFKGGAWRVLAVQLGGLEALQDLYRRELAQSPHAGHPLQVARFGAFQISVETARLWVRQACLAAEEPGGAVAEIDAYVDLARNAFEEAALRAIGLVQKGLGLPAFLRPNPIERVIRDLSTYLRQPALDPSLLAAAAHYLHCGGDAR